MLHDSDGGSVAKFRYGCCLISHQRSSSDSWRQRKHRLYVVTVFVRELPRLLSALASGLLLGGNVLCSSFLDSTNICGNQAPPGLEVRSLGCFEPSVWRFRSVALMAVCVMEIGLELSKLSLHVPSCGAPL